MSDIILAAMPYMSLNWPSLALGQLTAAARKSELDVENMYAIFDFAADIGSQMYHILANVVGAEQLLSEWMFARSAYEDFGLSDKHAHYLTEYQQTPLMIQYFEKCIAPEYGRDLSVFIEECQSVQQKAEQFIQRTAEKIVAKHVKIVGCGTSWMQYTPAIALLRRIKQIDPAIVTMLGGINCEGEAGYFTQKKFPWVDFVVSGEADHLFPQLCRQILTDGFDIPVEAIPYGVYCRQKAPVNGHRHLSRQDIETLAEIAIEPNLEEIPIPDYTDYFTALHQAGLRRWIFPHLVMETSRGCWKGQKQPCTFCGLNGKRMNYRTKSVARVLAELEMLSTRYGITDFLTSDTVLNMKFFDTLFQELIKQGKNYRFMFETVSLLKEHHVKTMAAAGVRIIQPGIESLHDELLQLLHKGNSAIHGIALLKYCLEQGVQVKWNLLFDIPGDEDRHYHEMAEFLPTLCHLSPPKFAHIRYDRFSVYHQHPEYFDLSLTPLKSYSNVYPFDLRELKHVVSFFQKADYGENRQTPGVQRVAELVTKWQELHDRPQTTRPALSIRETVSESKIVDTRPCACSQQFFLTGMEHLLYQGCRAPATQTQILQFVETQMPGQQVDQQRIAHSLQGLVEKRLLLHIQDKYLALASYPPVRPMENVFTVGSKPFGKKERKVLQTGSVFQSIKI